MNRLKEIAARLAAINTEIDTATGETLAALEAEVQALTEERAAIEAENARRQQLRSQVASGAVGVPAHQNPAPVPAPAEPTVEEQETRAFAGFIRGTVAQMRANEQNFNLGNNGAIIPTTIARKIIDKVRDLCPILAGADVYHVKGKLTIPVYGAKTVSSTDHDITVGYNSEFSELTADAGAFTSIELSGYLVGALTLVGKSILNNADFDLAAFVIDKMASKIAAFIEGELLNGSGAASNHCTGALSTTNTMNAGSVSAITADNLIDLQTKIKQAFQTDAVWTMHPDTFAMIKKLKDGNNRYLVQDDFTAAFPYRLLGKPVHLSDNMPKIASGAKAVLYGDYSGLAVNIHEDVSIEVLREKYATQHAIGIVGWLEIDSKVEDNQKLATLVMSTGA